VLDNKKLVPSGDLTVSELSAREHGSQIIFVLDAVNSSLAELAKSEDAIEDFLRARAGKLEQPTSVLIVSDSEPRGTSSQTTTSNTNTRALHQRGLFVHQIPPSTDGSVLEQELMKYKVGLHRILDSQADVGQAERVHLSLEALSFITSGASSLPGAKLVIWISPGWPFLARSEAKSSEQLFDSVIYFSNLLRTARIILYAINPEGVTPKDSSAEIEGFLLNSRASAIRANGHAPGMPTELTDSYYAEYVKGVRTAEQSNPNDLALRVLAYQSGGLVLQNNNDLGAQIRRCTADADALYTLSYTPVHGSGDDVYHELLRIPVMWATDSGDVGRSRSEATLVVFYISQLAHMSQEEGEKDQLVSFRFLPRGVARLWIPFHVGQHSGGCGPTFR